MSRQSLDMRYGRQGGRIVPWRPMSKPDEPTPAIVEPASELDENGQIRGQASLFDDEAVS